jgi:hypothetical protein
MLRAYRTGQVRAFLDRCSGKLRAMWEVNVSLS